jgi:hypothetical protein
MPEVLEYEFVIDECKTENNYSLSGYTVPVSSSVKYTPAIQLIDLAKPSLNTNTINYLLEPWNDDLYNITLKNKQHDLEKLEVDKPNYPYWQWALLKKLIQKSPIEKYEYSFERLKGIDVEQTSHLANRLLYKLIYPILLKTDFTLCNDLIDYFIKQKFSIQLYVSFLMVTHLYRSNLPSRSKLFLSAKETALESYSYKDVRSILYGLE